MNVNIFSWIREGVRQSVVAGVSDAIEQLGTSVDGDDIRPRLAEALRRPMGSLEEPGAASTARPRRLGRSIKDFDLGKDK